MSQVINTNVLSLNAQRNLGTSQSALGMSLQRLSSGLRINSAKDDAAGLAISERFSTQIRGLNVAVRNANDGISLAQTAEGALAEVGNNLQRIRELAVQASNATNSQGDRAALNAEAQQLISEITRVAQQTDFNGTALLDGTFSGASFQVGANAGQLIQVGSIVNAQGDELGSTAFRQTTISVEANALTDARPRSVDIGDPFADGLTVVATVGPSATAVEARDALLAAISADADATAQVTAFAVGENQIGFTSPDASDADVVDIFVYGGETNLLDINAIIESVVADINIATFVGAQRAIAIADSALDEINGVRADMGAVQNRFESVIANLQTSSENLSASRSRIRDTDFAAETAALTRAQVLQQAGVAMLSQANAAPQNVLALLR